MGAMVRGLDAKRLPYEVLTKGASGTGSPEAT